MRGKKQTAQIFPPSLKWKKSLRLTIRAYNSPAEIKLWLSQDKLYIYPESQRKQDQRSTAPTWYQLFSFSHQVSASDFQSVIIICSVSDIFFLTTSPICFIRWLIANNNNHLYIQKYKSFSISIQPVPSIRHPRRPWLWFPLRWVLLVTESSVAGKVYLLLLVIIITYRRANECCHCLLILTSLIIPFISNGEKKVL